jgi:RNase P protein component
MFKGDHKKKNSNEKPSPSIKETMAFLTEIGVINEIQQLIGTQECLLNNIDEIEKKGVKERDRDRLYVFYKGEEYQEGTHPMSWYTQKAVQAKISPQFNVLVVPKQKVSFKEETRKKYATEKGIKTATVVVSSVLRKFSELKPTDIFTINAYNHVLMLSEGTQLTSLSESQLDEKTIFLSKEGNRITAYWKQNDKIKTLGLTEAQLQLLKFPSFKQDERVLLTRVKNRNLVDSITEICGIRDRFNFIVKGSQETQIDSNEWVELPVGLSNEAETLKFVQEGSEIPLYLNKIDYKKFIKEKFLREVLALVNANRAEDIRRPIQANLDLMELEPFATIGGHHISSPLFELIIDAFQEALEEIDNWQKGAHPPQPHCVSVCVRFPPDPPPRAHSYFKQVFNEKWNKKSNIQVKSTTNPVDHLEQVREGVRVEHAVWCYTTPTALGSDDSETLKKALKFKTIISSRKTFNPVLNLFNTFFFAEGDPSCLETMELKEASQFRLTLEERKAHQRNIAKRYFRSMFAKVTEKPLFLKFGKVIERELDSQLTLDDLHSIAASHREQEDRTLVYINPSKSLKDALLSPSEIVDKMGWEKNHPERVPLNGEPWVNMTIYPTLLNKLDSLPEAVRREYEYHIAKLYFYLAQGKSLCMFMKYVGSQSKELCRLKRVSERLNKKEITVKDIEDIIKNDIPRYAWKAFRQGLKDKDSVVLQNSTRDKLIDKYSFRENHSKENPPEVYLNRRHLSPICYAEFCFVLAEFEKAGIAVADSTLQTLWNRLQEIQSENLQNLYEKICHHYHGELYNYSKISPQSLFENDIPIIDILKNNVAIQKTIELYDVKGMSYTYIHSYIHSKVMVDDFSVANGRVPAILELQLSALKNSGVKNLIIDDSHWIVPKSNTTLKWVKNYRTAFAKSVKEVFGEEQISITYLYENSPDNSLQIARLAENPEEKQELLHQTICAQVYAHHPQKCALLSNLAKPQDYLDYLSSNPVSYWSYLENLYTIDFTDSNTKVKPFIDTHIDKQRHLFIESQHILGPLSDGKNNQNYTAIREFAKKSAADREETNNNVITRYLTKVPKNNLSNGNEHERKAVAACFKDLNSWLIKYRHMPYKNRISLDYYKKVKSFYAELLAYAKCLQCDVDADAVRIKYLKSIQQLKEICDYSNYKEIVTQHTRLGKIKKILSTYNVSELNKLSLPEIFELYHSLQIVVKERSLKSKLSLTKITNPLVTKLYQSIEDAVDPKLLLEHRPADDWADFIEKKYNEIGSKNYKLKTLYALGYDYEKFLKERKGQLFGKSTGSFNKKKILNFEKNEINKDVINAFFVSGGFNYTYERSKIEEMLTQLNEEIKGEEKNLKNLEKDLEGCKKELEKNSGNLDSFLNKLKNKQRNLSEQDEEFLNELSIKIKSLLENLNKSEPRVGQLLLEIDELIGNQKSELDGPLQDLKADIAEMKIKTEKAKITKNLLEEMKKSANALDEMRRCANPKLEKLGQCISSLEKWIVKYNKIFYKLHTDSNHYERMKTFYPNLVLYTLINHCQLSGKPDTLREKSRLYLETIKALKEICDGKDSQPEVNRRATLKAIKQLLSAYRFSDLNKLRPMEIFELFINIRMLVLQSSLFETSSGWPQFFAPRRPKSVETLYKTIEALDPYKKIVMENVAPQNGAGASIEELSNTVKITAL